MSSHPVRKTTHEGMHSCVVEQHGVRQVCVTAVPRCGGSLRDQVHDVLSAIDRVMQALVRQSVTTVIWVTMQERRVLYRTTNTAIRAAAKRWPQIRIADWDDASAAKPKLMKTPWRFAASIRASRAPVERPPATTVS